MKKFVDGFLGACGVAVGALVGIVAGTKIAGSMINLLFGEKERKSNGEKEETEIEDEDDGK